MSSGAGLSLQGVSAGYGHTTVLEGLDLTVNPGERVGIIGRNGAGKTTTLATAMGLTRMRSGQVSLDGRDISALKPNARAKLGVGYVPQTRDVFPSLSVEENLLAGLHGPESARAKDLLQEAYALFPRLRERRTNWGNELSGGEQQMLSIARALMGEPTLLLLDEPLEGLSPLVAKEVMDSIHALAATKKMGIVLVEQQVELVLRFSARVLVLERGRCVFQGTPDTLRQDRQDVLAASIGLNHTHRKTGAKHLNVGETSCS